VPLLAEIIPSEPDADNTDAGNIHTQKQIFLAQKILLWYVYIRFSLSVYYTFFYHQKEV
jgi:hypothetical protein